MTLGVVSILEKAKEIPEHTVLRHYTDEKIKFIMEVTEENEDIQELENALGVECIELAIQKLVSELSLVDDILGFAFELT